ncbi:hypothetical protein [Nostoc sp.]|uniref:hypothetical protein n=1 Tax=Nostoc sp. TaxID=1180 RepID=UPI002FF97A69
MSEPTLQEVFGADAVQTATTITITKANLPRLTPGANNTAESLLTGIILQSQTTKVFNVDPSSISINQSITCANTETAKQKGRVHIKRVDSITDIFTVEGDAPCNIEVACGDCPPGYCRCEMPGYPGYCCLDCHATAEQIRVITNELRLKNG